MYKFIIHPNDFLKYAVTAFYHTNYIGMNNPGNPNYINVLKNHNFRPKTEKELNLAINQLFDVLSSDLPIIYRIFIDNKLGKPTICVVPRAKAEHTYTSNQLLFKKTVKYYIKRNDKMFQDGCDYIVRRIDTKTTHLPDFGDNNGPSPYIGITKDTCTLSNDIKGKNILLVDDIYTKNVNVDEDAIQALYDNGADTVIFYAVAKTGMR